ncbi:MAG: hypothetical protein ACOH1J_03830 [Microbacteriaceae bacterium]
MTTCNECSAVLSAEWKYCVRCGAAVIDHEPAPLPGAIRPDLIDASDIPEINPLALFGWSLGGILVAIAVVGGALALFSRP